ncbi:STAS domain-containing protein [Streptomyces sp. NPDC002564]|uniref:STAS domain-containing protein n=1 Tax=Streptomyces sp. NPDC002564 TaxID=3364649 RepID=UPI003697F8FA
MAAAVNSRIRVEIRGGLVIPLFREGRRMSQPFDEQPRYTVVTHQRSAAWVVELAGEVDASSIGDLEEATSHALRMQEGPLVFHLAGLHFADSTFLNHLLKTRAERQVILSATPPPIQRLLDLTGAAILFEAHPSLESAYAAAQEGPRAS